MSNYLVSFRGTLAEGTLSEIFSHSLPVASNAEPSVVASQIWDAWEQEWTFAVTGLSPFFPPLVTYLETVVSPIVDLTDNPANPDDGGLGAATHFQGGPVSGTGPVGEVMPSQNAIAVSMTGGTYANGVPCKGRFYLPGVSTTFLDPANGKLTGAATDGIAFSVHRFMATIKTLGHIPNVWSRYAPKHGNTTGFFRPVTQIRVGDRVDTIRRRRNSAPEVYSLQPLA